MFEERGRRDEEGGEVREGGEGGGRMEEAGGRRDQGECLRVKALIIAGRG